MAAVTQALDRWRILSIDRGSSSLKIAVYELGHAHERRLLEGGVDNIGRPDATLWMRDCRDPALPEIHQPLDDAAPTAALLAAVKELGVHIDAVGHRLVFGGLALWYRDATRPVAAAPPPATSTQASALPLSPAPVVPDEARVPATPVATTVSMPRPVTPAAPPPRAPGAPPASGAPGSSRHPPLAASAGASSSPPRAVPPKPPEPPDVDPTPF